MLFKSGDAFVFDNYPPDYFLCSKSKFFSENYLSTPFILSEGKQNTIFRPFWFYKISLHLYGSNDIYEQIHQIPCYIVIGIFLDLSKAFER